MKDYASMSDFEINRSVAIAIGFPSDDCEIAKIGSPLVGVEWDDDTGYATKAFDFCNNPADAWPIITGSMISIRPVGNDGQLWEASGMGGMKADYDKNPLRASMIVFLMMKEGE